MRHSLAINATPGAVTQNREGMYSPQLLPQDQKISLDRKTDMSMVERP